jgi:HSP20 family protein
MHASSFEMMLDQVRAIHRAITGSELPERTPPTGEAAPPTTNQVLQHFAELDGIMRQIPEVAERVPPFSFAPPLDVIGTERELIIELGVPGVERGDVEVELSGDLLIVSGARSSGVPTDGRLYYHAEIPRGPFRRVVRLPDATVGSPRIDVEHGIIRVRLGRAQKTVPAKA